MLENLLRHITEAHHIVFFIAGVLFTGVVSGVCTFYHARQRAKKLIVTLKD